MFVAVIVKLYAPAVVGVPEITPVVLLSVSPLGSVPVVTAKVGDGLPLALILVEALVLTVKAGIVPLIKVGAAVTVPE